MKPKRSKFPYRIVGARGEWFAWKPGFYRSRWMPHWGALWIGNRAGGGTNVTGAFGRTPFEALERLKRIEAQAC